MQLNCRNLPFIPYTGQSTLWIHLTLGNIGSCELRLQSHGRGLAPFGTQK
jgi:hypothetical protein